MRAILLVSIVSLALILCQCDTHEASEYSQLAVRIAADPDKDNSIVEAILSHEDGHGIPDILSTVEWEWVEVADGIWEGEPVPPDLVVKDGQVLVLLGDDDLVGHVAEWCEVDGLRGHLVPAAFLTDEGCAKLFRLTANNIGRRIAIIADGKLRSAPKVKVPLATRCLCVGVSGDD